MRAPYDLIFQYWPLEEQETLYRNSKALDILFILIVFNLFFVSCLDQLVITKHPHTNSSRRPRLIPVVLIMMAAPYHTLNIWYLQRRIRPYKVAEIKECWRRRYASFSYTSKSTRFLISTSILGNMLYQPVASFPLELSAVARTLPPATEEQPNCFIIAQTPCKRCSFYHTPTPEPASEAITLGIPWT